MANKTPNQQKSYVAGADLSAHQWKGVSLASLNTVGLQGATGFCVGVLQNTPRQGEAACVMQSGLTPVVADGTVAIAVGDPVGPNATGVFVKKTAATDPNVMGVAEEAATTAGAIIAVTLMPVQIPAAV